MLDFNLIFQILLLNWLVSRQCYELCMLVNAMNCVAGVSWVSHTILSCVDISQIDIYMILYTQAN